MSLFKNFTDFFYGFNKQQRRGLSVLLILISAIVSARVYLKTKAANSTHNYYAGQIDFSDTDVSRKDRFAEKTGEDSFVAFNPNTVSFETLLKMGIPERTCKTFIKYRNTGAVFKQKSDVKKVYGISDQLYEKLEPYIICETTITTKTLKKQGKPLPSHSQKEQLELNTADSAALEHLPTIGPSFARRIIKYRSILGGYNKINQLMEVYGFNDTMYRAVMPLVKINPDHIQKLSINTCEFKTLCKHPYVGYELCKLIFNWRRKTVITETNLKDIINNETIYQKLLPYLTFE
jgi:competence protein ComEA